MKQIYILIISLALFLFSCGNDNSNPVSHIPPTKDSLLVYQANLNDTLIGYSQYDNYIIDTLTNFDLSNSDSVIIIFNYKCSKAWHSLLLDGVVNYVRCVYEIYGDSIEIYTDSLYHEVRTVYSSYNDLMTNVYLKMTSGNTNISDYLILKDITIYKK